MRSKEEIMASMPTALGNEVLIANPVTKEVAEGIDKLAAKLPAKEKEDFFKKNMTDLWSCIEIIGVGEECKRLKVGDFVFATPEVLQSATAVPGEKYLLVRETAFKGKW
jgi:hypothetical protein